MILGLASDTGGSEGSSAETLIVLLRQVLAQQLGTLRGQLRQDLREELQQPALGQLRGRAASDLDRPLSAMTPPTGTLATAALSKAIRPAFLASLDRDDCDVEVPSQPSVNVPDCQPLQLLRPPSTSTTLTQGSARPVHCGKGGRRDLSQRGSEVTAVRAAGDGGDRAWTVSDVDDVTLFDLQREESGSRRLLSTGRSVKSDQLIRQHSAIVVTQQMKNPNLKQKGRRLSQRFDDERMERRTLIKRLQEEEAKPTSYDIQVQSADQLNFFNDNLQLRVVEPSENGDPQDRRGCSEAWQTCDASKERKVAYLSVAARQKPGFRPESELTQMERSEVNDAPRPGSASSAAPSGHPASGRPTSGRPASGRPASGRAASCRPAGSRLQESKQPRATTIAEVSTSLVEMTQQLRNTPCSLGGGMSHMRYFITGPNFDYVSGVLVLANAATMGMQCDWQARMVTDIPSVEYKAFEQFFCAIFTIELILRMWAYGRMFFRKQDVRWNLFDMLLVSTQLIEYLLAWIASQKSDGEGEESKRQTAGSGMNVMRVLRVLRLIRVMRLMRVLRLISELRALISSIIGSLRSLVWAMLLLFVMMYVVGIYLTQLVLDHRLGGDGENSTSPELVQYWGSLGDSILSLWMAVTGGVDWGTCVNPLRNDISVYLVVVFIFYIAFCVLCMLNVITGVFVESALHTAKMDKDEYVYENFRDLFNKIDANGDGLIELSEFKMLLDNPDVTEMFEDIDMDTSEAMSLFILLDVDHTNTIDLDEFINGCSRLRGPTKQLHFAMLHKLVEESQLALLERLDNLEAVLFTEQAQAPLFSRDEKPRTPNTPRMYFAPSDLVYTFEEEI